MVEFDPRKPLLSFREMADFARDGFVICAGLFTTAEVRQLSEEADRLLVERGDLISPRNLRCRFQPDVTSGEPIFEVFDPVCDIGPVCAAIAEDRRIHAILTQLLGEPVCLFKDKLIYKPPGARGYDLHQDIPATWPGFPQSFHTVLIAIDPMSTDNGCTVLYPAMHRRGFLATPGTNGYPLPDECVQGVDEVPLNLSPGDIAIFGGLVPHRSAPNRSRRSRRALYLSYNAESDGGSMRDRHYREFHAWMRERQPAGTDTELSFW